MVLIPVSSVLRTNLVVNPKPPKQATKTCGRSPKRQIRWQGRPRGLAPWQDSATSLRSGSDSTLHSLARHPIRPHLANRLRQRQSNPSGPSLCHHARRLEINPPLPSLLPCLFGYNRPLSPGCPIHRARALCDGWECKPSAQRAEGPRYPSLGQRPRSQPRLTIGGLKARAKCPIRPSAPSSAHFAIGGGKPSRAWSLLHRHAKV
jgi:hypothetical protein